MAMSPSGSPASRARRSLSSELFAVSGRTNRGRYWLTSLLVALFVAVVAAAVIAALAFSGADPEASPALQFVPLGALALMFPIVLAGTRRLHDRDKSGHWLWLFLALPTVLNFTGEYLRLVHGDPLIAILLAVPSLALSLWGFIEIACLHDTIGPNRFGPDPLEGLPA
jgi:uncharacterized membrane protein YhaH (DUF805 family)